MRTPVDNWREGTRAGHTHEANDVTVQLDGLGRQLSELISEPGSAPESSDGPVFVDESGRRSKTYRRVGWVLATICAVYAVTLVVALLGGNSSAPWLPISGQEEQKPAGVEVQPAPTDPTGAVTDAPAPSTPAADPVSTDSLPPSGRTPAPDSAEPVSRTSSSSASVQDDASESASGSAQSEPSAEVSSAPAAEPSASAEESGPGTPEVSDPSVREQEGAL